MVIDSFSGDYRFLSNFYAHTVKVDGLVFKTSEHAYQAAKCKFPEDRKEFTFFSAPGIAKRVGRQVAIRDDWEQVKLVEMEKILRVKFADQSLKRRLLATAPHDLIEGNTWGDTYWGVCAGVGRNHLGRILMQIRADG